MLSLLLCLVAFAAAYAMGRRSLVDGLTALLVVGYGYGILRANLLQAGAHFLFDAAVLGFYLSQALGGWRPGEQRRQASLATWLLLLMGWPVLLFFLPFQDPLIQLVGLRGNLFFLPFLLIGGRLQNRELEELGMRLAWLNLGAFAFAAAEYFLGIERFYPYSAVTDLIYRSNDVASYRAHRIPATFPNAHAYAGTMVLTIPLLLGTWLQRKHGRRDRLLLAAGLFVAVLGVFMAAARSHAAVLLALLLTASLAGQMRRSVRWTWVILLIAIAWLVAGNERLQRFRSLGDTERVAMRVAGSVNMQFLELASSYPMGNGLGGGGTSVPYFLQHRLRNPISMESEYSRIVLELGLPGLALWLGFLLWAFTRSRARPGTWRLGRRLGWIAALSYFGVGLIGLGTLTSVPQTVLLLTTLGWIASPKPRESEAGRRPLGTQPQLGPGPKPEPSSGPDRNAPARPAAVEGAAP